MRVKVTRQSRAIYAVAERLETRRMLADASPTLIDFGGLYHGRGDASAAVLPFQIGARWEKTVTNPTVGPVGTGMTLRWSIVPDGTILPSGNAGAGEPAAASNLRALLNARYGSSATWLPLLTSVFNSWSAVSGITYVYEPTDDGAPYFNASGLNNDGVLNVRGDVRIGAHPIDGLNNMLAYNYFPGDEGGGADMVIDSRDLQSGGFMYSTTDNSKALRNVMAHEHGHGLGFDHVDPINTTKLMEAYASTNFDGPQLDDILAVQKSYGDGNEKGLGNNTSATATNLGALATGTNQVTLNLSVSPSTDVDVYKFSIAGPQYFVFVAEPEGSAYQQGPQDGTTALFDPKNQLDFKVQLLASDGTTVLRSLNATGLTERETYIKPTLPAGTYYLRVQAVGGPGTIQRYDTIVQVADPIQSLGTISRNANGRIVIASSEYSPSFKLLADSTTNRLYVQDNTRRFDSLIDDVSGGMIPLAVATGDAIEVRLFGGTMTIEGTFKPVELYPGSANELITLSKTAAGAPVRLHASAGDDSLMVTGNAAAPARVELVESQALGGLTLYEGDVIALAPGGKSLRFTSLYNFGTVDLSDGSAVLDYSGTSPLASIVQSVSAGYAGGTWLGTGIRSSAAAGVSGRGIIVTEASRQFSSFPPTFAGQTVDATSLLLRYSVVGDADLNGTVDTRDFARLLTGYGRASPASGADFNYDGVVTSTDFNLFAAQFGRSLPSTAPQPSAVPPPPMVFADSTGDDDSVSFLDGIV